MEAELEPEINSMSWDGSDHPITDCYLLTWTFNSKINFFGPPSQRYHEAREFGSSKVSFSD